MVITPASRELAEAVLKVSKGRDSLLQGELANGWRYGDEALVSWEGGEPVAVASAHYHTARKNAWTPYVNWVTVWTRPEFRRRGHARRLSAHIRAEALRRGCVRLRSAVASRAGLALHLALQDLIWGRDPRSSMFLVDTPLDSRPFPELVPISVRAATGQPWPLSLEEVAAALRLGPLPYDVEAEKNP